MMCLATLVIILADHLMSHHADVSGRMWSDEDTEAFLAGWRRDDSSSYYIPQRLHVAH